MKFEIIKPFGPSIVKFKLPDELVLEMNKYADQIINDKKKSEDLNEGPKLAGNVQQEFLLDTDFMKKIKWAEILANITAEWIKNKRGRNLKNFRIIKSWIVRQFKNEYNPLHFHSGHISGVGYLKVPKNLGSTVQEGKKNNMNGKLELVESSPKFLCSGNYTATPQVGDMYLFPNYLLHTVYPFSGTEDERRSVSFNAEIDELAAAL